MDLLKGLIADSFNGITPADIPFLIFQLFSALLAGLIVSKIAGKDEEPMFRKMSPLIVVSITVLVSIVKFSLQLSILAAACIIILNPAEKNPRTRYLFFLQVGLGVLCGSGFIFLAFLFLLIITPLLIYGKK